MKPVFCKVYVSLLLATDSNSQHHTNDSEEAGTDRENQQGVNCNINYNVYSVCLRNMVNHRTDLSFSKLDCIINNKRSLYYTLHGKQLTYSRLELIIVCQKWELEFTTPPPSNRHANHYMGRSTLGDQCHPYSRSMALSSYFIVGILLPL